MKTVRTWRGTEDIPHLWMSDPVERTATFVTCYIITWAPHTFRAVDAALTNVGCHSRPVMKALHFRTLMALPACLPIRGQV